MERVSNRRRHCQTPVSGLCITPHCDLKQLSVMQWPPDRQRKLFMCTSERIQSYVWREYMWQTKGWDGESVGNLTGAFRHVAINFLLPRVSPSFSSWLMTKWCDGCFYCVPWGPWWQSRGWLNSREPALDPRVCVIYCNDNELSAQTLQTRSTPHVFSHLWNLLQYDVYPNHGCFGTYGLNHMLTRRCHLQTPLFQLLL